jgi:hypothetical protein
MREIFDTTQRVQYEARDRLANWDEFFSDCGYCIDAPEFVPAGSIRTYGRAPFEFGSTRLSMRDR